MTNTNNVSVTKAEFRQQVDSWAETIGVAPKEVHIRFMTRKWGSCSTTGRVTFNSELLTESDDLRKKVIVHELLHIKVPNHGKLFRSLLRAYLGMDQAIPDVNASNALAKVSDRK